MREITYASKIDLQKNTDKESMKAEKVRERER